jgi:hypothetical protein
MILRRSSAYFLLCTVSEEGLRAPGVGDDDQISVFVSPAYNIPFPVADWLTARTGGRQDLCRRITGVYSYKCASVDYCGLIMLLPCVD